MRLSESETINARLDQIGFYEVEKRTLLARLFRMPTVIQWPEPPGLENDLASFALRFSLDTKPRDFTVGLEQLLQAWERFQAKFPEYVPQFKSYLVELFRGCYLSDLAPHERKQYLGEDLQISDAAILRQVTSGSLGFDWDGSKVTQHVWFSVEWDDEHGAEIEFDAAGNVFKPWKHQEM